MKKPRNSPSSFFFIPSCLLGFAQSKCFPGCHYCKAFQQNWIIGGKEAAVAFLVGLEKSCNWSRLFSVVNKPGRSRFQGTPAGGFARHTNYGTFFGGEAPQASHRSPCALAPFFLPVSLLGPQCVHCVVPHGEDWQWRPKYNSTYAMTRVSLTVCGARSVLEVQKCHMALAKGLGGKSIVILYTLLSVLTSGAKLVFSRVWHSQCVRFKNTVIPMANWMEHYLNRKSFAFVLPLYTVLDCVIRWIVYCPSHPIRLSLGRLHLFEGLHFSLWKFILSWFSGCEHSSKNIHSSHQSY